MCTEAAGKPGSVVDDHFSQYRRCHRSSGAHLRLKAVRAAPCRGLGLLRVGFAMPLALRRERWALTPPFHPYRCWLPNTGGSLSVVLSLSPRDWRRLDLPVTLPCGARTFLGHPKVDAVVWRRGRNLWAKSGGATSRLWASMFASFGKSVGNRWFGSFTKIVKKRYLSGFFGFESEASTQVKFCLVVESFSSVAGEGFFGLEIVVHEVAVGSEYFGQCFKLVEP
jgi:hypothetical protein